MVEEVLKKLRFKPGVATVLNAPPGYDFGIAHRTDGTYDFVLLYVRNTSELEEWLTKVVSLLNEDAVFWVSYPKQTSKRKSDLNRDVLNAKVREWTSYRAVSNVAIDADWSALRFRPEAKVNSKR